MFFFLGASGLIVFCSLTISSVARVFDLKAAKKKIRSVGDSVEEEEESPNNFSERPIWLPKLYK